MTSKRHMAWHRALAKHWASRPIETCEVRFTGCFGSYGLSPAHSKDRGDIYTKDEFFEVVAACAFCHIMLDHKMSKAERLLKVREIIANRDLTVSA